MVEEVKAGLRNAKAKGKRLGRPKKILDTKKIATLRAKGVGWKRIAAQMEVWGRNSVSRSGIARHAGSFGTSGIMGRSASATIRMLDFGQQFSLLASM
jgi:DNA invertase Pin-like site-specific DNA recombinase